MQEGLSMNAKKMQVKTRVKAGEGRLNHNQ